MRVCVRVRASAYLRAYVRVDAHVYTFVRACVRVRECMLTHQHEHVVGADAQHQENAEALKDLEEDDPEADPVEEQGHGQTQEDLVDGHSGHERRAGVDVEVDVDEEDREDDEGHVAHEQRDDLLVEDGEVHPVSVWCVVCGVWCVVCGVI